MIKVVIADDHELIREGIKKIVRAPKDIHVVGEAASLPDTFRLIEQKSPHIVILDIALPDYDGLKGLVEVKQRFPTCPVLILSMYPEERFGVRALKAGASGYITKSMAAEELVKAIRNVISRGIYISPSLAGLLATDKQEPLQSCDHSNLTERELQVIAMLGSGKQIKQIAAELSISISSVNTYRSRIFQKTGLTTNAALVRYAIEHNLAM